MFNRIFIFLSIIVANACLAAEQSVPAVSRSAEQTKIKLEEQIRKNDAFIRLPFEPRTLEWLLIRYVNLFQEKAFQQQFSLINLRDGHRTCWINIPSNLCDALSTLSSTQELILEIIYDYSMRNKKLNLPQNDPDMVHYFQQYGLLPNLIKYLTRDCVKFESLGRVCKV